MRGSWTSVTAGTQHTCGVRTDRTLWCWGQNFRGQLGPLGPYTSFTPKPVQVRGSWLRASAGGEHTCARRTDHTLWCWGSNRYGQLASTLDNGTDTSHDQPSRIGTSWAAVSAGGAHNCAITDSGRLACWGANNYGQAGQETGLGSDQANPVPGFLPGSWSAVTSGGTVSCGVASGALWCWGGNKYGQLGDAIEPSEDPHPAPVEVSP